MTPTPSAVFSQLHDQPGALWLDGGTSSRGWSVLLWDPVETLDDPGIAMRAARALQRTTGNGSAPFNGGVAGFIGYEVGHRLVGVPPVEGTPTEPPAWLGRYDGGLCFDHERREWHATGSTRARVAGKALLASAPTRPDASGVEPVSRVATTVDRDAWMADVRRIRELIAAGDCYQINLTRPVFVEQPGDPFDVYLKLRQANAPYGTFLRIDNATAILSNSPELLLAKDGSRVRSVPIKGTRPRGACGRDDDKQQLDLLHSPKDTAELMMIVDLVRNDLSKVCTVGSVATGKRTVRELPTVHHAHCEVSGQLSQKKDGWHALDAVFPAGSVTGAPKMRACQRIAELESHPRGAYCGTVGFSSDCGTARWSVAIRTAVHAGSSARYHVGGGIVLDSDPASEWSETVDKARALAIAFGHGQPRD